MRANFLIVASLVAGIVSAASSPAQAVFQHGDNLAFTRATPGGRNLAEINTSTKNVKLLTSDNQSTNGEFSPNGKRVVFSSYIDGDGDLYVANADGSHAHAITHDSISQIWPQWTPDGKHIVFRQNDVPYPAFYSIKPDGTGSTPVFTSPPGMSIQWPMISPDGSHIGFGMYTDSTTSYDVYSLKMNGTGLKQLTSGTGSESMGDWSPNGYKIVFTQVDGTTYRQVYSMNTDGTQQKPLTTSPYNKYYAEYTADGSHIIYSQSGTTDTSLLWMYPDGSHVRRLTPVTAYQGDGLQYD